MMLTKRLGVCLDVSENNNRVQCGADGSEGTVRRLQPRRRRRVQARSRRVCSRQSPHRGQ